MSILNSKQHNNNDRNFFERPRRQRQHQFTVGPVQFAADDVVDANQARIWGFTWSAWFTANTQRTLFHGDVHEAPVEGHDGVQRLGNDDVAAIRHHL